MNQQDGGGGQSALGNMGGGGHGGYGGGGNKRKGQSNDPECRLDYVVSKPLLDALSIRNF